MAKKENEKLFSMETKNISEEQIVGHQIAKVSAEIAAPATEKAIATFTKSESADLGFGDIGSEHLLLPRILIMQGLSKFVQDGAAIVGEIRDSLDGKLLAPKNIPLNFLVFFCDESVIFSENLGGKFEYIREEKRSAANANLPYESEDGKFKYTRSLNFYALLPHDIASGEAFPMVLSFRSTSFPTGKKLFTQLTKLKMFGKNTASKVFQVRSEQMENDKGKFFTFELTNVARGSTQAEMDAAKMWNRTMNQSVIMVDDSDLRSVNKKIAEKLDLSDVNF